MTLARRWSRGLLILGVVAMVVGVLDPLEGSIVVAVGSACAALGTSLQRSRHAPLMIWAFALIVLGVGMLWGWSAIGGIGGNTGWSMWWALTLVPYPVGWVMGLVGGYRALRERTPVPPASSPPSSTKSAPVA